MIRALWGRGWLCRALGCAARCITTGMGGHRCTVLWNIVWVACRWSIVVKVGRLLAVLSVLVVLAVMWLRYVGSVVSSYSV